MLPYSKILAWGVCNFQKWQKLGLRLLRKCIRGDIKT